MTPHLCVSQSRMAWVAVLVVSSVALWGQPVHAGSIGYIGQTYQDNGGGPPNPPVWGQACTYTASVTCSYCGSGTWNPWGNMAQGCSDTSQDEAEANARATCTTICARAREEGQPSWGVYRPAGTSQGTPVGAGTIQAVEPGVFVGHLPLDEQDVDPMGDVEQLAHQLVEQTANPWLWLSGPAEYFTQDGGPMQGAYAEAWWSEHGEPEPRTACSYEAWSPCPCEDAQVDGIRACSEESDSDAWMMAESSCPALCYQARSASWGSWGLLGVSKEEGVPRTPGATLQAVEPGVFVAHVPSSLEPLGPTEDWQGLTDQLLELTQGADVWLAGPAEYFVCVEGAAR
jgi:hypothetical protein